MTRWRGDDDGDDDGDDRRDSNRNSLSRDDLDAVAADGPLPVPAPAPARRHRAATCSWEKYLE